MRLHHLGRSRALDRRNNFNDGGQRQGDESGNDDLTIHESLLRCSTPLSSSLEHQESSVTGLTCGGPPSRFRRHRLTQSWTWYARRFLRTLNLHQGNVVS